MPSSSCPHSHSRNSELAYSARPEKTFRYLFLTDITIILYSGVKCKHLLFLILSTSDYNSAYNSAKRNFFETCNDPENDAFGTKGIYKRITGTVNHMDLEFDRTITVDGRVLNVEDLIDIEICR